MKQQPTPCALCGQHLRVKCPTCGTLVFIDDGHFRSHPKSMVMGGHIEWKTCPGSGCKREETHGRIRT